jgi:hypothetical protein
MQSSGAAWPRRSRCSRTLQDELHCEGAFAPDVTVALVLLLVRSALSQMDVPTRTCYVMAVVTPQEQAAAASLTAVPRTLASSISPAFAGVLSRARLRGLAAGDLRRAQDRLRTSRCSNRSATSGRRRRCIPERRQ